MSDNAYENWADAFPFSDDLKNLETLYQEQHQEELEAEATASALAKISPVEAESPSEDQVFLSRLSEQIAHRLGEQLTDSDILFHYKELDELKRDNVVMAKQIQALLHRLDHLEQENLLLREHQSQFHPLIGKIYYKNV